MMSNLLINVFISKLKYFQTALTKLKDPKSMTDYNEGSQKHCLFNTAKNIMSIAFLTENDIIECAGET